MKDYCAGCGGLRPRHDMQFVCGYLYRCDHCRGDVKRFQAGRHTPKPRQPRTNHTRIAQLAAAGAILGGIIATGHVNSQIDTQRRTEQQHLREAQQRNDERDMQIQDQLHHMPYGPEEISEDGPTEFNGAHFHCEEGRISIGINVPGAGVGGKACRWEWPNGDLAPPPSPLPHP